MTAPTAARPARDGSAASGNATMQAVSAIATCAINVSTRSPTRPSACTIGMTMAAELEAASTFGVELIHCSDLEDAVHRAAAEARSGETVLLSPACASFDAFADYEQRGERFREIVAGLR